MQGNIAYGTAEREGVIVAEPMYEHIEAAKSPTSEETTIPVQNKSKTCKKSPYVVTAVVATVALLALALALGALIVTLISKQDIKALNEQVLELKQEIRNLRDGPNFTESQRRYDDLMEEIKQIHLTLRKQADLTDLLLPGTKLNPASSCKDIPQDRPSGDYWIQSNSSVSPVQVYCDTGIRNCSCNATGPWMRVANLDMTDPSQQCPDGFRQINRTATPLRTCDSPGPECVSTTYPTHGIEYSRVCGRVIGYQFATPDAFSQYIIPNSTVDNAYVDGVSLTHGQSPRQHIWTFANAHDEVRSDHEVCPCTKTDSMYTGNVPQFVGQDYFCETGSRLNSDHKRIFYSEDPLWDGQGCGGTSTCCSFNNPPWFCKKLPEPTTDDVELRVCRDEAIDNEGTPIQTVEIYVQ